MRGDFYSLIGLMQASFFFGISIVVLCWILFKDRGMVKQKKWGLILFLGVNLMVASSLITFFRAPYPEADVWYILVMCSYVLIDIGTLMAFRENVVDKMTDFSQSSNK